VSSAQTVTAPVTLTEADVERMAAAVGLVLEPASRAAVAEQLAGVLAAARLVTEFRLAEDVAPAPVFSP